MIKPPGCSTLVEDGWILVSAEERAAAFPQTFQIPPRTQRESMSPGEAAKLLFDIESREAAELSIAGLKECGSSSRIGPSWAILVFWTATPVWLGVKLREGDLVAFAPDAFAPEHVASIGRPPREYVVEKYGVAFFDQ